MKTFALFLCLIATTADAAPLYLTCEGKLFEVWHPSEAELVTYSIRIDGTNVTVEGGDPAQIDRDDGDVLAFAGGVISNGTINRITGRVEVRSRLSEKYHTVFQGVCHKTEKRF